MSRNVRKKNPITPVKAIKRRRRVSDTSSSSFDLSDEDGYSAVEEISDSSDDDEEDVAAAEEENILGETNIPTPTAPRPRLILEDAENSDADADDDDDEDEDEDDAVAEADEDEDEDDDDNGSWAGIMSDVDEGGLSDFFQDANVFGSDTPVERHVHFDVPSSDSDSTDTEDDHADLFPDIFVSQNALDPAFRREIENDPDESSGSGSFWDYSYGHADQPDSDVEEEVIRQLSDDDTPTATPRASQPATVASTPVPSFEEPQELDGYETDGDTTEEDIPEPPVRRKTRRPSNPMSEMSDSDTDSPVKSQRGQPRVGRFNLDRSDKKPIAVLNPLTRKMMIFTPGRRRQLDLSPEQFHFPWPMEMEDQSSPILSNSANMMLSAMFSSNTFGDFINTQAMGPAEAFFPFPSEANTVDESSTAGSVQDDEDDEEKLNINDFIMWDDGQSSGDEGEGEWDPSSTPARPSTAGSEIEVLSHLNSETVGAFRRNQINQQLILSNQATQDSLAFSGPYNYTALKGLKSDRFDTAAVPLTPMRRHKRHMSDAKSPLESVSAKRKASSEVSSNHKRHRSISDVNLLRI